MGRAVAAERRVRVRDPRAATRAFRFAPRLAELSRIFTEDEDHGRRALPAMPSHGRPRTINRGSRRPRARRHGPRGAEVTRSSCGVVTLTDQAPSCCTRSASAGSKRWSEETLRDLDDSQLASASATLPPGCRAVRHVALTTHAVPFGAHILPVFCLLPYKARHVN